MGLQPVWRKEIGCMRVGLCLVAIVKKDSVVLRKVSLCCSFFLEVDLLLMAI